MIQQQDIDFAQAHGVDAEQLQQQLDRFKTGFPYLKLMDAARVGQGITRLTEAQEQEAVERWQEFLADGGDVCKFVPASGAASRMFKKLFEFVASDSDKPDAGSDVERLLAQIDKVAFYADLNETTQRLHGLDVKSLLEQGRDKDVVSAIIRPEGLNYGQLPKGLLKFHNYPDGSRTPLEEQLTEGAQTAANSHGVVKIHFTVSGAHRKLFEQTIADKADAIGKKYGVRFDISLSEQKPSTDTVAANPDGTPFRTDEGTLLFRPGGHGALLSNLNDIDATVVFIKNIDNVVPDAQRVATVHYKQVLGGYLMQLHDKAAEYMAALHSGNYDRALLQHMLSWLHSEFSISDRSTDSMDTIHLAMYLHRKLSRPMRVCGMVKNEGEPGGGPFVAYNSDGSASLQILESTQIDPANADYAAMMASATHFNPVDLVCYVADVDGHHCDLMSHADADTGFISSKSAAGRELRAMELPGLWNGAMSDWLTAFVEVPIATFNPVKTVNDLLRPTHQ